MSILWIQSWDSTYRFVGKDKALDQSNTSITPKEKIVQQPKAFICFTPPILWTHIKTFGFLVVLEGLNEAEAVLEGRDVAALWRTKPPALLLLPDN